MKWNYIAALTLLGLSSSNNAAQIANWIGQDKDHMFMWLAASGIPSWKPYFIGYKNIGTLPCDNADDAKKWSVWNIYDSDKRNNDGSFSGNYYGSITVNVEGSCNTPSKMLMQKYDTPSPAKFYLEGVKADYNSGANALGITVSKIIKNNEPPSGGSDSILPTSKEYSDKMPFRGVNMSGFEWSTSYQAALNPQLSWIPYYIKKGVNIIRVPIKWSYIQPNINQPINFASDYAKTVDAFIGNATASGLYVILDLHAYMRYCPGSLAGNCSTIVTADELANTWKQLAEHYKNNPKIIFDVMNEPNNMKTKDIYDRTIAAIKAIDETGASNYVSIEGNGYTGANSWTGANNSDWYDKGNPNGEFFTPAKITQDTGYKNILINVHLYFSDPNGGGGGSPTCAVTKDNVLIKENADSLAEWINATGSKVIMTEIGAGNNENCKAVVNTYMDFMMKNATNLEGNTPGFVGWLIWNGNPNEHDGTSVYPDPNGNEKIQFAKGFANYLTAIKTDNLKYRIAFQNELPRGTYSLQFHNKDWSKKYPDKEKISININGGSTPEPIEITADISWATGVAIYDATGNQYKCPAFGNLIDLSTCTK